MKPWRLVIAGLQDPGIWDQLASWQALSDVECSAIADASPVLIARAQQFFPAARLYPAWPLMLRVEQPHILHAALPVSQRPDIIEEAGVRGIHCSLEGPLATTPAGAHDVLRAARRHGFRMVVDWAAARDAFAMHAVSLCESGLLGSVQEVTLRSPPSQFQPGVDDRLNSWLPEELQSDGARLTAALRYATPLLRALIGMPAEVQIDRFSPTDGNQVDTESARPDGIPSSETADSGVDWPMRALFRYPCSTGMVDLRTGVEPGIDVRCRDGWVRVDAGTVTAWDSDGVEIDCSAWAPILSSAPESLLEAVRHGRDCGGIRGAQTACDVQDMLYSSLLSLQMGRAVNVCWA